MWPGSSPETHDVMNGALFIISKESKAANLKLAETWHEMAACFLFRNDLYATVQFEKHTWGRTIQERLQQRVLSAAGCMLCDRFTDIFENDQALGDI